MTEVRNLISTDRESEILHLESGFQVWIALHGAP